MPITFYCMNATITKTGYITEFVIFQEGISKKKCIGISLSVIKYNLQ